MAVPAIKTALRNEILRILQEDITYDTQEGDSTVTIDPRAIVIQKTRAQVNRPDIQENQLTDIPGLLLCSPFRTPISETDGTNERDVWTYLFLVQLVDADLWSSTDRLGTWDKWIEDIMSAFMFSCLNGVVTLPQAQVKFAAATQIQDIDERRWVRDAKFIAGIEIKVEVLQPRGLAA